MRRSGITSRSKCAIFSISQMSCSSAGPRGPAVMMLVLSATGDPVALVKRLSVVMTNSSWVAWHASAWRRPVGPHSCQCVDFERMDADLAGPGGSSDNAAEIAADEMWIFVGEYVGLDVAECRFGL